MKLISILKEIKVLNPNPFERYTAEWWFYKLPEPYRKQALTNFKKDEYYKDDKYKYNNISDALYYGFPWSNTPEGYDYWNDIYYKLKNNEPLTEIKVLKPKPFKYKTIGWWLHQLPEPYRKQALTNYRNETEEKYLEDRDIEIDSLFTAIDWGFRWITTPEGYDYWKNIRDKHINGNF